MYINPEVIMATKTKEYSIEDLKKDFEAIKSSKYSESKASKLTALAKAFAAKEQWNKAIDAFQYINDENTRNLLIAELIEEFLLPLQEINTAKKFAKYLTPVPEIQPLVMIRIALAEKDREQAIKIAERLPSPLSRNFAFVHIAESYLANGEKEKAHEIGRLLLDNIRTIYDFKSRSFILRELALNLYLAFQDKEQAKKIALLIPDVKIRNQVIKKITAAK